MNRRLMLTEEAGTAEEITKKILEGAAEEGLTVDEFLVTPKGQRLSDKLERATRGAVAREEGELRFSEPEGPRYGSASHLEVGRQIIEEANALVASGTCRSFNEACGMLEATSPALMRRYSELVRS